jgi:hypothetical protein
MDENSIREKGQKSLKEDKDITSKWKENQSEKENEFCEIF